MADVQCSCSCDLTDTASTRSSRSRSPLGHEHDVLEACYSTTIDICPAHPESRIIWFIERCRTLEAQAVENAAKLAAANAVIVERDREIAAFKVSNKELKALTAELVSSLQVERQRRERADTKMEEVIRQHHEAEAARAKAEKELKKFLAKSAREQVTLMHTLQEAAELKAKLDLSESQFEARVEEYRQSVQSEIDELHATIAERDKQLQASAEAVQLLQDNVRDLDNQLESANLEQQRMLRAHQHACVTLGKQIESLEHDLVGRDAKAAAAVAHAEKVSAQFDEQDKQLAELRKLAEIWSAECQELHRVLREFQSKNEQQAEALAHAQQEVLRERQFRKDLHRKQNLEHMAAQDMARRLGRPKTSGLPDGSSGTDCVCVTVSP